MKHLAQSDFEAVTSEFEAVTSEFEENVSCVITSFVPYGTKLLVCVFYFNNVLADSTVLFVVLNILSSVHKY